MDALIRGYAKAQNIELVYVDATESARELERRHLAGPAAGKALAEALVATAMLSSDAANEGECLLLQMRVDGPLGGVVAEAAHNGALRGYTFRKKLDDFDTLEDMDLAKAWGETGLLAVTLSVPGRLIYSGQVSATPPNPQRNLARYYNESKQLPAGVEILAVSGGGQVKQAVGLAALKMAGCSTEDFVAALELFQKGAVRKLLADATGLDDFRKLFGYDKLEILAYRELRFGCRCTREKCRDAVAALDDADLRDIAAKGQPQDVTCHFCGETWRVSADEVRRMLEQRGGARRGA
ncbi:MAG TPA: Hsp33 family molecular chaperone HslO [Candidatus Brocadiia bacterium]|nr:Hsp33 family molecular chaperone HslO [Candidatus Brocadiia bacterium]